MRNSVWSIRQTGGKTSRVFVYGLFRTGVFFCCIGGGKLVGNGVQPGVFQCIFQFEQFQRSLFERGVQFSVFQCIFQFEQL